MVNHPNRGWRKRWTVDLESCTATHRDGWIFRFTLDEEDGAAWDGKCISQPVPLPPDFARIAHRIAREAGEIYRETLRKRH
ncbi:MAG: hypothetical protein FWH15_09555 [Betaproteobacteria bacterium]|nr:hypothetical protein [Betaproteobacteria bacterium]